jgi:hypothetical protein
MSCVFPFGEGASVTLAPCGRRKKQGAHGNSAAVRPPAARLTMAAWIISLTIMNKAGKPPTLSPASIR